MCCTPRAARLQSDPSDRCHLRDHAVRPPGGNSPDLFFVPGSDYHVWRNHNSERFWIHTREVKGGSSRPSCQEDGPQLGTDCGLKQSSGLPAGANIVCTHEVPLDQQIGTAIPRGGEADVHSGMVEARVLRRLTADASGDSDSGGGEDGRAREKAGAQPSEPRIRRGG